MDQETSSRNRQDIEQILASFRTPFWLEHKKWFVTCEYDIRNSHLYLYSTPVCISSIQYILNSDKISLSTSITSTNNDPSRG
jgi:hypothetical protein